MGFFSQDDDEEIDPDVRELGDYFNIEERWVPWLAKDPSVKLLKSTLVVMVGVIPLRYELSKNLGRVPVP